MARKSSGVAKGGLITGIIGTSLAGVQALGGGLLNGGSDDQPQQDKISALMAENAALKSERYTDGAISAQRDRLEALNKDVIGYVIDLGQKIAVNEKEAACLAQQVAQNTSGVSENSKSIVEARLREVANTKDVECLAGKVADGFASARNAIAAIQTELSGLTRTVIPAENVCPEPQPKCQCGAC